ncbi:hypothetical protein ACQ4PT_002522 [Festuca glaucescens]
MAGGPMLQLWNEWATQILVLLSFTLQIFLFVFARTRRHGSSAVLRILLWLVYLMGSWLTPLLSTLSAISQSMDTITGYALEDNKLWPRHLLNLAVQAFGVAYVLYKHIAEIPTSLRLAAGLIFIIGLIKYAERIWALKCATLVSIRSSINNKQRLPNYDELPSRGLMAEECDEEELLLFAQAMLPLCKGAMADSPVALFSFKVRGTGSFASIYEWKNWNWKATSKVVQMELSLMYDIIHTCHSSSIDSVKNLLSIMQNRTDKDLGEACVTLWHGTLYARLMLELVDAGNTDKPGIISSYEDRDHAAMDKLERLMPDLERSCSRGGVFDMPKALALILDGWVRLLVFASIRCSRDAHASQINRGGELMTVVWLMEEHANVFFKQPTPNGIESFLLQALR